MTIHADRDASERPAAQLDTAEIRARAHNAALADARRGRQPWRTLTDDVPTLCDEVDRLRAIVSGVESLRQDWSELADELRLTDLSDRMSTARAARELREVLDGAR